MVLKDRQHKESEIGLVPEDWDVVQLSTIGKFSKGQGIRKDEAMDGEIPCVRYGELYTKHSDYIKQYYSFITQETSQTSKKLRTGDILFAGSGETKEEIGKCAAFIDDIEVYAGGDIVILSPTDVEPLYLGYLLNAPIIQRQKASKGQGDAIVHISANQLGSLQIPLPPTKSEQTAIATALSDADALIENLERLIEKKRNIKQGAMQELLTPQPGWVTKRLGELLDYEQPTKYLVEDTEYNSNNLIPVLTAGKTFILGYTNEDFGVFENLPVIIFDDFTTASKYVTFPFKAKSSAMKMLKAKNKEVILRFVFEMMQTINFQMSDHKRYWISEYQNIEIKVPRTIEQIRIAKILGDMDTEIEILERSLTKYKMIKQGMMQTLLTGKIRLI